MEKTDIRRKGRLLTRWLDLWGRLGLSIRKEKAEGEMRCTACDVKKRDHGMMLHCFQDEELG